MTIKINNSATNFTDRINWYGTYILTIRETSRFLRVYNQAIIAPAVSALIFLLVFVLAMPTNHTKVGDVKFINFMGYGLIIMSILQNAFANSSSSLIMSKVVGYIHDILLPPLSGIELVIAFALGSLARGIIVGIVVTIFLFPFLEFTLYHPFLLIFFTVSSCLFMGMMGVLSGIISNSFEQHGAINSYLITPLSFLSGTFYSVELLPKPLQFANLFNPFFYMIDGFRYSLTDYANSNINIGAAALAISNIALFIIITKLLNNGWRIKE